MTPEEKELAWEECLELWRILSEKPDDIDAKPDMSIKYDTIKQMGITKRYRMGCPLCERYLQKGACTECPISIDKGGNTYDCLETPYRDYEHAITEEDRGHVQALAKAFYDYLLQLKEKSCTQK